MQKKEESQIYGEISKILKVPKEEITLALDSSLPVNSIEENVYSSDKDGNELNILDTLKSNKDEANLITNKIVLNKIINSLEKRDKEIILLRYYKDKTQSEVGKILGISQVQVSRIEKRILEKMKKELA
ncbi:MAG: sigma-70 family RNA polymerase sigma factor [Clostridia bacterium]